MSNYNITEGIDNVLAVFKELKNNPAITYAYIGETILNIQIGSSGVVYEPNKKRITTFGKENSKLLNTFNELINKRGVKLEQI